MLQTVDHPLLGKLILPTSPMRYGGEGTRKLKPSKALGADTAAILLEFVGADTAVIEDLRTEGVV